MSTKQKALAIAFLLAANGFAWFFSEGIIRATATFAPETIPMQVHDFRGEDLPVPESVPRVLGATSIMNRRYRSPTGAEVELFTAFYQRQKLGHQPHAPEVCLIGGGWEFQQERAIILPVSDPASKEPVEVKEIHAEQDGWSLAVLSCHVGPRATFPTSVAAKFDRIADSILLGRTDALFVRFLTRKRGRPTEDQALYRFARLILPAVYKAYER